MIENTQCLHPVGSQTFICSAMASSVTDRCTVDVCIDERLRGGPAVSASSHLISRVSARTNCTAAEDTWLFWAVEGRKKTYFRPSDPFSHRFSAAPWHHLLFLLYCACTGTLETGLTQVHAQPGVGVLEAEGVIQARWCGCIGVWKPVFREDMDAE